MIFAYVVAGVLALSTSHVSAEDFGPIHHYYNGWNGKQCNHNADNKKIPGESYKQTDEPQPDDWWCSKMCRKEWKMTKKCKAWNWDKDTGECSFFDEPVAGEDNSGFMSGEICEMFPSPCEEPSKTVVLDDMAIDEPTISPCASEDNEPKCGEKCAGMDGCMSSVFDEGSKSCCLHWANGNGKLYRKANSKARVRCESGEEEREEYTCEQGEVSGKDYVGNNNVGECQSGISFNDCKTKCDSTDGCMGAEEEDGKCCLKDSMPPTSTVDKPGAKAYIRCTPGKTPEEDYECKKQEHKDYDYPGNDMECFGPIDKKWCFMRADLTYGAVGATHKSGNCCLKSYMDERTKVEKDGYTSYTRCESGKPKDPCEESSKEVIEDGMDYQDENIGSCFGIKDLKWCRMACDTTDGCMGGTFHSGSCCLKRSTSKPVYKKGSKAFRRCTSGRKPDPLLCGERQTDVTLSDDNIDCTQQKDVHWCHKRCWMNEKNGCRGYSYNPVTDECCIKKGADKPMKKVQWWSSKMCTCGEKLTDLEYEGKGKCMEMDDEEWCAEKCDNKEECMASTFKDRQCCFFKNVKNAKKTPGATSYKKCFGTKPKPEDEDDDDAEDNTTVGECKRKVKNIEYPGHTVQALTVTRFKECRQACINRADGCKYFSFHKSGPQKGACHLKKEATSTTGNDNVTSGCLA